MCRLACSIANFGRVSPAAALLKIDGRFPEPGVFAIRFCDQCGACADVCPVEAIELNNGVYTINTDECIACHECVAACPRSVMVVDGEDGTVSKCVMCGECAEVCPRQALVILETSREGGAN